MGSKEKKSAEYQDTFTFELFPEYEYTTSQDKRLRLFQGRVEHYKKAIGYADSFDSPERINLLYMIGYNKNIKNAVMNTKTNLVILCAEFSKEDLKIYDKYHSLIKSLMPPGYANKDGTISNEYYKWREYVYRIEDQHQEFSGAATKLREDETIINDYESLKTRFHKYYKRLTLIDKLHPEKTISHDKLDWIIRRYFPKGFEQCGIPEKAFYAGSASVKNAIRSGLDNAPPQKAVGAKDDPESLEVIRQNIKRCEMNINVAIRKDGYANMANIFAEMQKPPYGWPVGSLMTAYCLASALSSYKGAYIHYHNHNAAYPFMEVIESIIAHFVIFGLPKETDRDVYKNMLLFTYNGWHLSNRLSAMFGIPPILPVNDMLVRVKRKIESKTRIPVSILDNRLHSLLLEECDYDSFQSRINIKDFEKYYTFEKCAEIYDGFTRIDEVAKEKLHKIIPGADESILYECTSPCSGWLWSDDFYWDAIRRTYGTSF